MQITPWMAAAETLFVTSADGAVWLAAIDAPPPPFAPAFLDIAIGPPAAEVVVLSAWVNEIAAFALPFAHPVPVPGRDARVVVRYFDEAFEARHSGSS